MSATDKPGKRLSRREFLAGAGVFAGGLVLSGCRAQTAGPTTVPTTIVPVGQTPTVAAVPTARPDTMLFGFSDEMLSWDPEEPSPTENNLIMMAHMFDTLVDVRLQQTDRGVWYVEPGTIIPSLAEEWQFEGDGASIVFKLREDITFSDGTPLTADDGIWMVERGLANQSIPAFLLNLGSYTVDPRPERIDDHTFRVYFNPRANALSLHALHFMFTDIRNSREIMRHATTDDPWARQFMATTARGLGTGYYTLDDWSTNSLTLTARRDNWGGPRGEGPAKLNILGTLIPDPTARVTAMMGGAIDVTQSIGFRELADMEASSEFTVERAPGPDEVYMVMHTKMSPFDDVRVRQAMNCAINKQELVDAALYGYGKPRDGGVQSSCGGQPYYSQQYPYDLNRARELLTQAGYENGFEFTLSVEGGLATHEEVAVLIASQLAELNIQTSIQTLTAAAITEGRTNRTLQAELDHFPAGVMDPIYVLAFQRSSLQKNAGDWYSEEFDGLVNEAINELDDARRTELANRAQQVHANEAPVVPLVELDAAAVLKRGLAGVRLMYGAPRWWDVNWV